MADARTATKVQQLHIVSLLPSITEILCELGLSSQIVGITHECDYPKQQLSDAVVVTTSDINPHTMTQAEINEAVCGSLSNGQSLYSLRKDVLQGVKPDIIFTQSLCDVCAVSYPVVLSTCAKLMGGPKEDIIEDGSSCPLSGKDTNTGVLNPKVVSLEPKNLVHVLDTFHVAAKAIGCSQVMERANEVTSTIEAGLNRIREAVKDLPKPRVAFIEWHDPIFCGGHWIVDMLEVAGGDYVMPVERSGRSIVISNEDFIKLDPDVILIGPCGFDLERTVKDTLEIFGSKKNSWWHTLRAVKGGRVFVADANSYYARPGPRLLQGTGIMAAAMHGVAVAKTLGEDLVPASGYYQILPEMYNGTPTKSIVEQAANVLSATPAIPSCSLQPRPGCALFVAWNGVITLVYEGFPLSLVLAKQRFHVLLPNLKDENFGSKWPKTTLAAVKDDAPDLTTRQLERLRQICGEHSNRITTTEDENDGICINVDKLSVVEYESRGLEKLAGRQDIFLDEYGSSAKTKYSEVSVKEKTAVDKVVEEWCNLETYLPKANAPGSRISSYRRAALGATCVAFLDPLPTELQQYLTDFRKAVDNEFPSRYIWLEEYSLHCTLRSID